VNPQRLPSAARRRLARALGNNRGTVLVITLFVVTLVTILVLEYHLDATVEVELTDNYANNVRAYHLALSGLQFARAILEQDDPASDAKSDFWSVLNTFGCVSPEQLLAMVQTVAEEGLDLFRERETVPEIPADSTGSACVQLSIVDEARKLPLNVLAVHANQKDPLFEQWRTIFGNLFAELEIDEDALSALIDWVDSEDRENEAYEDGGGEDEYYQGLQPPYKTPDRPLEVPGELRLIRHFTCETLAKLFPGKECKDIPNTDLGTNEYLTTYGEPVSNVGENPNNSQGNLNRVNINTANEAVLRAITQGNLTCVEEIIDRRISVEGQVISEPIQNLSDLPGCGDMDQFADVKSTYFRIESQAVIDGLIQKKIVAILKRGASGQLGGGAPGSIAGAFTMVYYKVE
jgi:type II secretory pathway component PulK